MFITKHFVGIAKKYKYFQSLNTLAPTPGVPRDAQVINKMYSAEVFFKQCQRGNFGPILLEDTYRIPRKYKFTQIDLMMDQNKI